jgi:hypothetical protein
MRSLTAVYIPLNRNKDVLEFKQWCSEKINYYSTETTWVCERKARQFLVFTFGEATDAVAFRLAFGL